MPEGGFVFSYDVILLFTRPVLLYAMHITFIHVQVINSAAKTFYMSGGVINVPIVFR